MMSGNGSSKARNSESGTGWVGRVKTIRPFCFAAEIREWVRHLSGIKDYSPWRQESEPVLRSRNDSSLVVDRLCKQTTGQSTAVPSFYLDFAARKEQSAASMLGSLLKQIVSGMETIPEEISRALREQKKASGGHRPQLADAVKLLQLITCSQHTFMCIDALDECAGVQRVKLLDSLNQILVKSPRTRIFMTGRPHIRAEIERRLVGRVISVSVVPTKDDIITYLRVRLSEDETPDAMDEGLEAEILDKIPEKISELCVGAMIPGILLYIIS